jgi:hypothetical protein
MDIMVSMNINSPPIMGMWIYNDGGGGHVGFEEWLGQLDPRRHGPFMAQKFHMKTCNSFIHLPQNVASFLTHGICIHMYYGI